MRKPICANCPNWQRNSDGRWGYCCFDESYHITEFDETCEDHPYFEGMLTEEMDELDEGNAV